MALIETNQFRFFFKGQLQHAMFLLLLVPGAFYLAQSALDGGSFLGFGEQEWFWAVICLAVLHQLIGWLVFRLQLVFGLFTKLFGNHDLVAWGILFFPLLVLRPVLSVGLALADSGSMVHLRILQIVIGLVFLIPVAYTGWSIKEYFGVKRALGADHFREEYREKELVQQGAFKYSSNAMYSFAFLIFWSIALLAGSWAALISALFQHAYVWVHWYCTEQTDIQAIYGI